jgi:hypothetical protein
MPKFDRGSRKTLAAKFQLVVTYPRIAISLFWHLVDQQIYPTLKKINPKEEPYPNPINYKFLRRLRAQFSPRAASFCLCAVWCPIPSLYLAGLLVLITYAPWVNVRPARSLVHLRRWNSRNFYRGLRVRTDRLPGTVPNVRNSAAMPWNPRNPPEASSRIAGSVFPHHLLLCANLWPAVDDES